MIFGSRMMDFFLTTTLMTVLGRFMANIKAVQETEKLALMN